MGIVMFSSFWGNMDNSGDVGVEVVVWEEFCGYLFCFIFICWIFDICLRGRDLVFLIVFVILFRLGEEVFIFLMGVVRMVGLVFIIEEFDDVSEVYVVVTDNFTIGFY